MHLKRLCLLLLLVCSVASDASAIQLKWANGNTNITFSSATRCTLVLSTDANDQTLPTEWQLQWVADTLGVTLVEEEDCLSSAGKVASIDHPATPADSAANLLTTHFCSAETSPTSAWFVFDQPAGSRGKFRVVALDPDDPDSNSVTISNIARYNRGVLGEFPPAVLRANATHNTATLEVSAVGVGLSSVHTMQIGASDNLWSVPLSITERSDHRVSAVAEVASSLPVSYLQAASDSKFASPVKMDAEDPVEPLFEESAATDTILFFDRPGVYPKDFAFTYASYFDAGAGKWKSAFHLFYIRAFKSGPDSIIAHAWCDTLGGHWTIDSLAFRPSGRGWDKMKVWAPSIQQVGDTTYMFYTGVDSLNNQSTGYAKTTSIRPGAITWTRLSSPVYTAANASIWADGTGHQVPGVIQFRDPFVMPDPDVTHFPNRYLLFIAGEDKDFIPDGKYAVGVARNVSGTLSSWQTLGKYVDTDDDHLPFPGSIESPMIVRDSLSGAWRMFVANAAYDPDGFFSTVFLTQDAGDSVTHRSAGAWPYSDSLYAYVGDDADVIGWQACEHLQIGQVHYFAGYNGDGIGISRMHWDATAQKFFFVRPTVAGVAPSVGSDGIGFSVLEIKPMAQTVRFAIDASTTISPKLVVYDVLGRRVRKLLDGPSFSGRREVTWDCRDESGGRVSSGIYFARLTGAGRSRVLRIPMIR